MAQVPTYLWSMALPSFFSDWWSVAEDPTEDSSGPQEWQSTKKEASGPWFTALMRTAPWPGTLVGDFIQMKEKLLLCLFIEAIGLSDYYTFHYSPSSLENFLELERQFRVMWAMSFHAGEPFFPWCPSLYHGPPGGPTAGSIVEASLVSDSCLVPAAAYFLPILKWRMVFPSGDQSFCPALDI